MITEKKKKVFPMTYKIFYFIINNRVLYTFLLKLNSQTTIETVLTENVVPIWTGNIIYCIIINVYTGNSR